MIKNSLQSLTGHTANVWASKSKPLFYILPIFWILTSCFSKVSNSKPDFTSIEVTYHNETGVQTIFIDSQGIILKCKYQITNKINSSICCVDTLTSEQIDTLNSLIQTIKFAKIDTSYEDECQDGIGYFIRINLPGRLIQSKIWTCSTIDSDIFRFANRISDLKIDKNLIDTMLIFETTKKVLVPIPPKK
jgi:hypothetical protein